MIRANLTIHDHIGKHIERLSFRKMNFAVPYHQQLAVYMAEKRLAKFHPDAHYTLIELESVERCNVLPLRRMKEIQS